MDEDFKNLVMQGDAQCCPTCGQFAKLYRRRIHKTVALSLMRLYKMRGAEHYVHVKKFMGDVSGTGDIAKAAYWGLIEPMKNHAAHKRTSGMWMLTKMGVEFVRGEIAIRKFALIYNSRCIDLVGPMIYLKDCIGADFDYQELMERL